MKAQPISSLDERLKTWELRRKAWLMREVPLMLISCEVVWFVMLYAMYKCIPLFANYVSPQMTEQMHLFFSQNWYLLVPIFGAVFTVPILVLKYPRKPTQRDVDFDIKLRQIFNMDID